MQKNEERWRLTQDKKRRHRQEVLAFLDPTDTSRCHKKIEIENQPEE